MWEVTAGCVQKEGILRRVKAEFTVEAALVLPIVLLVFVEVMHQGVNLYVEVRETAANESSYDAISDFRQRQMWNKLFE